MPRDLALGNGLMYVAFDEHQALRELTFPRVGLENHTLGRAGGLGVAVGGRARFVDATWEAKSRQSSRREEAFTRAYCPEFRVTLAGHIRLADHERALVRTWTLGNEADQRREIALLVHHDFALLENDLGNAVVFDPERRQLLHYKRNRWLLIDACVDGVFGIDDWSIAREDDHGGRGVRAGAHRSELDHNPVAVGAGDSLMALRVTLPANGSCRIAGAVFAGTDEAEVVALAARWRSEGDEFFDESGEAPPDWDEPLDHDQLESVSIAVCGAHCDDGGAILAGGDSHQIEAARESYAYCWPRDGARIARALDLVGRHELASRFFDFAAAVMHPGGYFLQRYNPDGTPASSWHARPSSSDATLPIQEDETALVVWALAKHLTCSEVDEETKRRRFDEIIVPAADFMVSYRDPVSGLPRASHDLWEERFGIHTFTVAAVAGALIEAASIAESLGEKARAAQWLVVGEAVRKAMARHMFHRDLDRYARCAHPTGDGFHLDTTVDASLAGLFLFNEDAFVDNRVISTMRAVERVLRVATDVGGYARYQDDHYHRIVEKDADVPGNPWIISSLWLAEWKVATAHVENDLSAARAILDWVLERAGDSGALAEQFHPLDGRDWSVRPLPWSHAAYLSTRHRLRAKETELAARAAVESDD